MEFLTKITIKKRLISIFLFLLIVPTIVIGTISYFITENQLNEEKVTSAEQGMQLINQSINTFFETKTEQISMLAEYLDEAKLANDVTSVNLLFDEYLALHDDVDIIYAGLATKEMIRRPFYEYDASYDPTARPWYQAAMNSKGEPIITAPYISSSSGELVVTIAQVLSNGQGVVGMDVSIEQIATLTNMSKIGKDGFYSLLDASNQYIAHPSVAAGTEAEKQVVEQISNGAESFEDETNMFLHTKNESTNWTLIGAVNKDEMLAASNQILVSNGLVVAIFLLLGSIPCYAIIVSIVRPLRVLTENAEEISKGNLTVHLNDTARTDEIGKLNRRFSLMRDHLHEVISSVKQSADAVQVAGESLSEASKQTIEATEQASSAMQTVAIGADEQLQENMKNTEVLTIAKNNLALIDEQNEHVTRLTQMTTTEALKGQTVVQETVTQMQSIEHSVEQSNTMMTKLAHNVEQIRTIVAMITDIADQTNLLSLNASIEAARAGEHGKGFAVVAHEVGALATNSRQSAEQIRSLIRTVIDDTEMTVEMMQTATKDVQKGLQLTNETSFTFESIMARLQQIDPVVEQVTSSVQEMNQSMVTSMDVAQTLISYAQQTAASSEEVAASSEEISASMQEIGAASETLRQMATELNAQVNNFKI